MLRILIVDDDLYIRDLYQEICTDAGYDVSIAVDGEDGLAKLRVGGYDLVLLDVMMPKKDGIAVLQELKDHPPQKPNNVILILTNLANVPVMEETLRKGAKGFLIKTETTPDILLEHIKKHLTQKKIEPDIKPKMITLLK